MNNLNSVLIEGNLVRDPERFDYNGGTMARFGIGVNRYYRNAAKEPVKETSFITIQAWGALAEGCCKYLRKGRGVRVVGRLKQIRWLENGLARDRHVIVAEHVEFKPEPKDRDDVSLSDTTTHRAGADTSCSTTDRDACEPVVLEQPQEVTDALSAEEALSPEAPSDSDEASVPF